MTNDGNVIGYVFGGCEETMITYIAPIDFVLERIKTSVGLDLELLTSENSIAQTG